MSARRILLLAAHAALAACGGASEGQPQAQAEPITPSTQLCAGGGRVASASFQGVVCLSPVGSGGRVATSASYTWIPGPAHVVQAE